MYLYFKDKDEIFESLHDEGFQKMQEFNHSLASIQNPLLRLHKMGENYIRFGMENPEYYNLMFILGEPMKKISGPGCEWKPGDAAIDRLKATVTECMEKGYLAKGDPQLRKPGRPELCSLDSGTAWLSVKDSKNLSSRRK